jgi:HNH endonuclease
MSLPAFSIVPTVSNGVKMHQLVITLKKPYSQFVGASATLINMMIIPKCRCGGNKRIYYKKGKQYISAVCKACARWSSKKMSNTKNYRIHKKEYCEACGFVAKHISQLDVDHIDGNSSNNNIDNLQTLCANCHRLKTHENRDYVSNSNDNGVIIYDPVLFDLPSDLRLC